jgi:hypothetical protein
MDIRTVRKPDKTTSMFWPFLYAVVFVAMFGGLVFTALSLVTGMVNKDRRLVAFGLRCLLFSAVAGIVFLLLLMRIRHIIAEEIKDILDSL